MCTLSGTRGSWLPQGGRRPDQPPLQKRGSTPSTMNVHLLNLSLALTVDTQQAAFVGGTRCPHRGPHLKLSLST